MTQGPSDELVTLKIPFEKILKAVDQMTPQQQAALERKLKGSWEQRLSATLERFRVKTKEFDPDEVERNVAEACGGGSGKNA